MVPKARKVHQIDIKIYVSISSSILWNNMSQYDQNIIIMIFIIFWVTVKIVMQTILANWFKWNSISFLWPLVKRKLRATKWTWQNLIFSGTYVSAKRWDYSECLSHVLFHRCHTMWQKNIVALCFAVQAILPLHLPMWNFP